MLVLIYWTKKDEKLIFWVSFDRKEIHKKTHISAELGIETQDLSNCTNYATYIKCCCVKNVLIYTEQNI